MNTSITRTVTVDGVEYTSTSLLLSLALSEIPINGEVNTMVSIMLSPSVTIDGKVVDSMVDRVCVNNSTSDAVSETVAKLKSNVQELIDLMGL